MTRLSHVIAGAVRWVPRGVMSRWPVSSWQAAADRSALHMLRMYGPPAELWKVVWGG